MGNTIRMVPTNPDGSAAGPAMNVPEEDAQVFVDRGFVQQTNEQRATDTVEGAREDYYSSPQAKFASGALGVARAVTGGLSDAAIRAAGSGQDRADVAALREHNKGISTVAEIGGALLPGGAGALAARAGKATTGAGILGAARGAAVEGGILGAQQGVSELALSKDPLTIERAASVLGSNMLFGAATGGAIGATGKIAEKGLRLAKGKLDKIAANPQLADDAVKIEQRAQVADEIKALRSEMKEQKIWLATKDADVKTIKEVREVGKVALEADRSIDRMLRNPKALAQKPQRVLDGLQQQEHALETLLKQGDNLRPIFAADKTTARAAALDYAQVALEKNRALQVKIGELTAKPVAQAAAQKGLGDALQDAGMGYMLGAATGIPVLGQAFAAAKVGMGIVKKLGLDSAANAARGSKAIESFLNVSAKVAPTARLAATKTLSSVAYGEVMPDRGERDAKPAKASKAKAPTLADAYRARTTEIRNLTAPGPDGKPVMRPEARAKLAERLKPIAAADPLLADKIETNKARAIEYLARMEPKMPDLPGMDSKTWQPSDMEMRAHARRVAGVEDPHGIVERLADGSITPEDAVTMKEVFPEMYADIQAQIMMQMGELRGKLPYQRRLALSIFSGVPVDPALDPRVLAALQGTFANEPGTEGGTQAPQASPQFGSVTKPSPTPAQERGA